MTYCTKCGNELIFAGTYLECPRCGAGFNTEAPHTKTQNAPIQNSASQKAPRKFQHLGRLISGIILFLFSEATPWVVLYSNAPESLRLLDLIWRILFLLKSVMAVLTVVFICQSNGSGLSDDERERKYQNVRENNNTGWACCGVAIVFSLIVSMSAAISDWGAAPEYPEFIENIISKTALATNTPSMEEADVKSYFGSLEDSEAMSVIYDDGNNGISVLKNIYDNSSVKFMASFTSSGDDCKLTGKYNGKWYYGWGTKDKMLLAAGNDKDLIYSTMKGYEEKFTD